MASCGDVLSLEDLQTAKKHQLFEAEVITGKAGGVASGTNIEYATNQVTGQTQITLPEAIANLGIQRIGDFTTGCTVTQRNQGVLEVGGSVYVWLGALPKVVPAGSSPLTTGGLGPAAWADIGDASAYARIVALLDGDDGFNQISYKPSTLADAVKRTLANWAEDGLTVDVKWVGAEGDWNCGPSQAGTDDTLAFERAVLALSILGNRRNGAVRRLIIPAGNYRLKYMPMPVGISFALNVVGEGNFASQLFFDNTDTTVAIDCVIESLKFSNIGLFGSLSDATVGDPASWKDIGFKGRNSFNTADVDVKFESCSILFWKEFAHTYGRGVVFDNCEIGQVNSLLNIVCDPTIEFLPGNALGSVETGMRNITVRNCRTDQVLVSLIRVTGTGPQKDYINDITIHGNDFVATAKLIDAPDATLRITTVTDNNGLYSFRAGFVSAKGVDSILMDDNNLARRYEATVAPTGFLDCVPYLLNTTETMHNAHVHNNITRNLSGNLVSCATTTPGNVSHVSVKNNMHPNGWTYFESPSNICYIFLSLVDCPFLEIEGNQFDSTVTSRTYRVFNPAVQTNKNTFIGANPAPWSWTDTRLSYLPVIYVNGVVTSVAPTARSGRFHYDGTFVHYDIMLISAFTETSGAVEISAPPITAIAENSGVTTSYGGYGVVTSHSGWVSAGNSFSRCVVNPVTQRIQLFKEGGMVRAAVTAADKSGTITLYISGKYRA